MINGLKRTFWSSIHKKKDDNRADDSPDRQKPSTSRFGFFSNPPTPRSETRPDSVSSSTLRCQSWSATAVATPSPSLPASPKLQCKTSGDVTPTRHKSPLSLLSVSSYSSSTPSSPKSPASFSLLKSKLCFTKSSISSSKCGICLQSAKAGRGTAIFTAECSHTFHFPCVASSRAGDRNLISDCPVCGASWRETSLLPLSLSSSLHELDTTTQKSPNSGSESDSRIRESKNNKSLRVYNDDEPLISSPISRTGFNTIPESDENDDEEEEDNGDFKGFFVNTPSPLTAKKLLTDSVTGHVDVKLSSEAAIVAVGRGNETYSVLMKIKSPPLPAARRSPVDLVTVIDVSGGKIEMVKQAMRHVISSLRETDRLSMVSFSSSSKRLSPLRRMTVNGRRLARRIVDEITGDGDGMSVNDAVKKAAKVIEDRRQKNLFTTIFVITDHNKNSAHQAQLAQPDFVTSTRFSHLEIPTHTIWLGASNHALPEDVFAKRVKSLLTVSVQDLTLNLGLVSGSGQGEVTSVYSLSGRPVWLGSGLIRLGDMYGDEEREVLVELKSPSSNGSQRIMTVQSRHVDPTTQEIRNSADRAVITIPYPIAVRSSNPNIARLRNLHVSTRAVAESRRLIEANDYSGAERMLTSARTLLVQYDLSSGDSCLRGLDAELAELNRLRGRHVTVKSPEPVVQKTEPLTPTSAWRAAERLAKVAIMRKHMNRVSDLHGFENARF